MNISNINVYNNSELKELQSLMVKYGITIRAIPETYTMIIETRHIDEKYPNEVYREVKYSEDFKRDMLYVTRRNSHGGKFLLNSTKVQVSTIRFNLKQPFDNLEDVFKYLIEYDAEQEKK